MSDNRTRHTWRFIWPTGQVERHTGTRLELAKDGSGLVLYDVIAGTQQVVRFISTGNLAVAELMGEADADSEGKKRG